MTDKPSVALIGAGAMGGALHLEFEIGGGGLKRFQRIWNLFRFADELDRHRRLFPGEIHDLGD